MILFPVKQPAQLQPSLLQPLSGFWVSFCSALVKFTVFSSPLLFTYLCHVHAKAHATECPTCCQQSLLKWETIYISLTPVPGEQVMLRRSKERGDWIHHPLATAVLFDSRLFKWFLCILGSQADWKGVVPMEIHTYKSANQPQEVLPSPTSKIQVSRELCSKPSSYMQRHFKHFWGLFSKIYGYSKEYLHWRLQASV